MRTLKSKIVAVLLLAGSLGYSQNKKMMHQDHNKMEMGEMEMTGNEAPKFKNKEITAAYDKYLSLKEAILQSNSELVQDEAQYLAGLLAKIQGAEEAHNAATVMAASKDLDSQKTAFSQLSSEFATFLKNGKVIDNQLYVARCPMANNNSGGFWLSHEQEILNPFFGGKMLKCGSIQETIK